MKILATNRRKTLAVRFTGLALASLVLTLPAALLDVGREVQTAFALAALVAYCYFAWRAMKLWQGRRPATLHSSESWRRHFCDEPPDQSDISSTSVHRSDAHGAA